MEQKVVIGGDGLYCLCFFNSEISEEQVREDFGKYGEIVNYKKIESGMNFVRYGTEEEAQTCLNSMLENSSYRGIRVAAVGNKKQGDHSSISKRSFHEKDFSQDNTEMSFKKFNPNYKGRNDKFNQGRPNQDHGQKGQGKNPFPLKVDDSDKMKLVKIDHQFENENGANMMEEQPQLDFAPGKERDKEMELLPTVETTVVVLANYPPWAYSSDLYALCASVDPLMIDMRENTGSLKLNYAYVHLRNQRDAENLIKELDNVWLEKRLLTCALVETLIEEAK